ncbi:MAG: RNA polymerase sigma-70 factor [Pseudoflavonifractor sp.]|nr:RNA polymerase sigma-70 factor [Pseudoflavonifractor sp.]
MRIHEFETLYRRLYMPLGMYALRVLGDVDEAEDAVQESFASVWELIGEGAVIENLKAYMYRAVRNECLLRLRSRRYDVEREMPEEITDEVVDTSERDARLWDAIGHLPDRCREIFLMSKRDGLTNADIASELGLSVKTVENQMTKAFKTLRDSLRPEVGKVFFLPFL